MITDKIYTAIIVEIILQALILVVAVVGIIVLKIKSERSSVTNNSANSQAYYNNAANQNYYSGYTGNVTYCRNCAGEYDASLQSCPHCGTPR
ncbi:MAG: hypothetical protein ACI4IM_04020 [Acutalibacteraceae bacterium]